MKNFGSDLKDKSQRALESMSQSSEGTGGPRAPVRPVTSIGNLALVQPQIDALNERTKEAERRAQASETKSLEVQLRATELEERLAGQPSEASLSELVEVPGRRRKLTPEEFFELTENLRNNPLVTPVSVKRLGDGRYEIVSGHNRVHAFRALGRPKIAISVVAIDEDAVERAAFYANLLQPSLPDFEKFHGFRQERDRHDPKLTQRELARAAGVAEKFVSRLFAFEELPPQALSLIERHPQAIGSACVAELVRLVKDGRAVRVVEAIAQLVEGKIGQKEAIAFASRAEAVSTSRPEPIRIRSGRVDFCRYVVKGNSLRIEFKDEAMRVRAEKAVDELLRKLAEGGAK
jgi:ParB family chromosome partitioning protein